MNGAESLVQTLVQSGVSVCFANPGTSEMHFVGGLDSNPGVRCVLCLFEGVASGAADGYARMTGTPAATLLHLGPGLANAGANLHNAMRAATPIVNIVGDHATDHRHLDPPLAGDVEALARVWSIWVRSSRDSQAVASDAADAVRASLEGGGIATLILPADTAWNTAHGAAAPRPPVARPRVNSAHTRSIAETLRRGEPTLLLIGGKAATDPDALDMADRICQAAGAEMMAARTLGRIERGAGRVLLERFPYSVDAGVARTAHFKHCICVETKPPVAFFAYPDKPGRILPDDCATHFLALPGDDAAPALGELARELNAGTLAPRHMPREHPAVPPSGPLTPAAIGESLALVMPDNTIVCDESVSLGGPIVAATRTAPPHSWLPLTGGSIGLGLPLSVGVAVACPDRRVVALQADGSGMYTVQALWTQARERLDVTTIVLSNRAYAILRQEFSNVGIGNPGPKALGMTSLGDPDIDWVALAAGMGVAGARAESAEQFHALLGDAFARPGPYLIEAVL